MKRIFATLLLSCALAIGANAQILYKISGKGLKKPSYVLGTYHFSKVSFVDEIPGIRQAMASTDQVYGEIDMKLMESPENMAKLQKALMLEDGKKLKDVLSADQMTRLNGFMKSLLGVDMSNPLVEQQFGSYSPSGLVTSFSGLIYIKNNPNDFDPNQSFDGYFQDEARKVGKKVGSLETVDFQINTLINGYTMNRSIQLLMCMVDHPDLCNQQSKDIVKAFYTQNLKAIKEAMDEKANNECDNLPEEDDRLINNRNANWLKLLPGIFSGKPTLLVVGCGHLVGEKGILQGLRNLGYQVEGVK